MNNTITCPKCGSDIEISEVMRAQLGDSIRTGVLAEYEAKLSAERKRAEEKAQHKVAVELKDRDQQIKELIPI